MSIFCLKVQVCSTGPARISSRPKHAAVQTDLAIVSVHTFIALPAAEPWLSRVQARRPGLGLLQGGCPGRSFLLPGAKSWAAAQHSHAG